MTGPTLASLVKVAEGGEAEIFAWGEGRVLRLLRDPAAAPSAEIEAAASAAARAAGVRAPATFESVTIEGRTGLVMERVPGRDLLTLIGETPWRVFASGRLTGEVHARLNAVVAPAGLPPLRAFLASRLGPLLALDAALGAFALATLEALPDGEALCHGDFHPGQLLLDGKTPVVIDWNNATRGDPLADHARTRVVLAVGQPPPGSALVVRTLQGVGRRMLLAGYNRGYHAGPRPLDREMLRRWETVQAAARLAEGYESERPALLARLRLAANGQEPTADG